MLPQCWRLLYHDSQQGHPGVLEGQDVKANILAMNSGQTKRVSRSTLAAEASHLAEAVKADDWIIVLLEVICEIGRR